MSEEKKNQKAVCNTMLKCQYIRCDNSGCSCRIHQSLNTYRRIKVSKCGCGDVLCSLHMSECDESGMKFCNNCAVECSVDYCNENCCSGCFRTCEDCESEVCYAHAMICSQPGCFNYVCVNCAKKCDNCHRSRCGSHSRCDSSGCSKA